MLEAIGLSARWAARRGNNLTFRSMREDKIGTAIFESNAMDTVWGGRCAADSEGRRSTRPQELRLRSCCGETLNLDESW